MRNTDAPRHIRSLVVARSQVRGHPSCERCGAAQPEQIHHRKPRRLGGTRDPQANQPANLVAICAACHLAIETHRNRGYAAGWLVRDTDDPAATPIHYRRRWSYLDNQGAVTTTQEAAHAPE